MIYIIKYTGGLGNQMFQYAFFRSLKHKFPLHIYIWDIEDSKYCHNGFELPIIFRRIYWIRKKINNYLRRRIPSLFNKVYTVNQMEPLRYSEVYFEKKKEFVTMYDGFWQTEYYFKSIEKKIRKAFQFDERIISEATRNCCAKQRRYETISIHIRRGDYLAENNRLTIDDSYYHKAIETIKNKVEHPHFLVFSDDIIYAKNLFHGDSFTIIDWNTGKDNWQDLFLMSKCKHNIIANSSFSWWGAWLNPNPQKIVIAPKIWFYDEYNLDIVPKSWIRI